MRPPIVENEQTTSAGSMKQSVSMTSLPPSNGPQEISDMGLAKLRLERPYNSLKKKRNSERDIWRSSWGSGHSHSSCSIHSTATNVGKDDFWAALQYNYNYIMDTNLLDSCREARGECNSGKVNNMNGNHLASNKAKKIQTPEISTSGVYNCCSKLNSKLSVRSHAFVGGDQRRIRRWLREMENHIAKAPSLSQAIKMKSGELQKRLRDHSDLYREIVSQARVVGACIRASDNKSTTNSINKDDNDDDHEDGGIESKRIDNNLKALERRYHLLYLKAIEIQCMFEGLLGKKDSASASTSSRAPSDTDEEPVAKVAKLSENSAVNSSGNFFETPSSLNEGNFCGFDNLKWQPNQIDDAQAAAAGFDADSEGSDTETVPTSSKCNSFGTITGEHTSPITISLNEPDHIMETDPADVNGNPNPIDTAASPTKISINNHLETSVTSVFSCSHSPTKSMSPTKPNVACKRSRQTATADASKFNRSNRKSKNCAIFYFKHLDTDTENKDDEWSSQVESEGVFNKSTIGTSEYDDDEDEDEWFYTNNERKGLLEDSALQIDVVDGMMDHMEVKEETNGNGNSSGNVVNGEKMNTKPTADSDKKFVLNEKQNKEARKHQTYSKESIQQLVLDAETLVREEILQKTPTRCRHSLSEAIQLVADHRVKNCAAKSMSHPKIKRVQEWLQHHPPTVIAENVQPAIISAGTTDCEASGEYTESDSAARDSDSSEGPGSDSVATCLQEGGINSQCTSTEKIGGSGDLLSEATTHTADTAPGSNIAKVTMRTKRRHSERPWSVSCLSQLTQTDPTRSTEQIANQGLANHSISESALNTITTSVVNESPNSGGSGEPATDVKNSDSKSSLKRRKMRFRKRVAGKKSESVSNGSDEGNRDLSRIITSTLHKSESFSGQSNLAQDLSMALSLLTIPRRNSRTMTGAIAAAATAASSTSEQESDAEENRLSKPNFQLGAYTKVYGSELASKLGSLAALANYNRDKDCNVLLATGKDLSFTGTDNSNHSEQAWDNYQEKYNSEAYSEGFDSDAARRLLEFGDDYRNFLDSQSDCCSSLSAANNLDSLSPPAQRHQNRFHSIGGVVSGGGGGVGSKSPSKSPIGDDLGNSLRRRRATLAAESDKRRKGSDSSKRLSYDESRRSFNFAGSHNTAVDSQSKSLKHQANISRKLEMEFISTIDRRHNSANKYEYEDNNSILPARRRRRSNNNINGGGGGSSSSDTDSHHNHSDDEIEIKALLGQSRTRLENTEALKIRQHLLRPEDYLEIITTCRDNVRCLESVLRGPPGTVLSSHRSQEIRELLSSWESLLQWSENASVARQLQEEMSVLKSVLNKLGNRCGTFDSESTIQLSIEELKNEKAQLHTHRSSMLRLNASVHSWLTRQEMKMAKLSEQNKQKSTNVQMSTTSSSSSSNNNEINSVDNKIDNNLNDKHTISTETNEIMVVDDDDGDVSCNTANEELHKRLKNEVGDMYSAWDEADQRISSRLESLTTSLIAWKQFESGLTEFKEALGKDKGALKGLKGALDMGNNIVSCIDGNCTTTKSLNILNNNVNLADDVKEVAKRLSEKIDNNIVQQNSSANQPENIHLNPISAALPFTLKSLSNGSLSDSGISDGGGSSDYGLSERERRLGALRRLARQLENALAPGSAALNSITQRMKAAEAELRTLQDTCRELIVRTAASQQKQLQQQQQQQEQEYRQQQQQQQQIVESTSDNASDLIENPSINLNAPATSINIKAKQKRTSPQSKRATTRRRSNGSSSTSPSSNKSSPPPASSSKIPAPEPDPNDPSDTILTDEKPDDKIDNNWAKRVAKYALPVQLALVALLCAVCCLEPHCCDAVNNFSMSLTPHLRYVRGPPPI